MGESPTYEEAMKAQEAMKDKGFRSTFIVAYKNGARISVNEAKTLLKNNKVN